MSQTKQYLALDVGTARIGVALADDAIRIAITHDAVEVDGQELEAIARLVVDNRIDTIVVGYPRNQAGEPTQQTKLVETFASQLTDMAPVVFQDESLTSVLAEERLKKQGGNYTKGDIDSQAAVIILEDYLETRA